MTADNHCSTDFRNDCTIVSINVRSKPGAGATSRLLNEFRDYSDVEITLPAPARRASSTIALAASEFVRPFLLKAVTADCLSYRPVDGAVNFSQFV